MGERSCEGRESPRRITLYLIIGAAMVYLATWTGPVAFYLTFQKPLLARERDSAHGVLWVHPVRSIEVDSPDWQSREEGGLEIPLPPGRLVEIKSDASAIRARFEEGEVILHRHRAGFLVSLLEERLRRLGITTEIAESTTRPVSDAAVLEEIAGESLQGYSFCWPEPRRQRYAARLLCKMALWDDRPVRRFEMASRPGVFAVLAEHASGDTKVITANASGVLVIVIPAEAPPAWKASPASWLR